MIISVTQVKSLNAALMFPRFNSVTSEHFYTFSLSPHPITGITDKKTIDGLSKLTKTVLFERLYLCKIRTNVFRQKANVHKVVKLLKKTFSGPWKSWMKIALTNFKN